MRKTTAILLAVATGLVGAALLHIVIILSLPNFTRNDAFARVRAEGGPNLFHLLGDETDAAGLSNNDPYLKVAVCHYETALRAVRLLSPANSGFWSLAVFDSQSNEVFSMNDRTSVSGVLDVIIASPLQVARIRKATPAALAQAIVVEVADPKGYAVLRTMVPQPSFESGAVEFLTGADCLPVAVS